MLLEDDDDEIQIIPQTNHFEAPEDGEVDATAASLQSYPPMPDWLNSVNGPASNQASSANTPTTTFDLDDLDFAPARITLGRVARLPEPVATRESTPNPQSNALQQDTFEPSSPVEIVPDGGGIDEEVVDLDTREDTPPRRTLVSSRAFERREADVSRSRHGLIDTQPQDEDIVQRETVLLPISAPPRLTIPLDLAMQRSTSMNASTSAAARDLPVNNEEIVDLDTREDTPPPRQQAHSMLVGRKELSNGSSRQVHDLAEAQDEEILPLEMELIPMPASPPPEMNAALGVQRTYSMAQPMANADPPSKNNKATSVVAKARASVRAYKGADPATKKKGKGRSRETEDGQGLSSQLSKLDAEVSSIICCVK
ncbi:hypothetical protein QFC19_000106 [Naganishia cerealis]|uniref:Uncharacterized protein n=1 Tax=Naganishia cerealis TaxID=610337 RepID=A0ACC2WTQ2_9TREE|nr:hypothetical protein QFC19_000106 [Naganishia cerealis]